MIHSSSPSVVPGTLDLADGRILCTVESILATSSLIVGVGVGVMIGGRALALDADHIVFEVKVGARTCDVDEAAFTVTYSLRGRFVIAINGSRARCCTLAEHRLGRELLWNHVWLVDPATQGGEPIDTGDHETEERAPTGGSVVVVGLHALPMDGAVTGDVVVLSYTKCELVLVEVTRAKGSHRIRKPGMTTGIS